MAVTIQVKRGNRAGLPTLSPGEYGLATDTQELFIGGSNGNVQIPLLNSSGDIPSNFLPDLSSTYVPTTRTVNGKALSSNITLGAADVGAVPTSRTVNGKALTSNITLGASDIGLSNSIIFSTKTVQMQNSAASYQAVCYGNGVIISPTYYSGSGCQYSYDGFNWASTSMPSSYYWQCSAYGEGIFVASRNTAVGAYSPDGINWTQFTPPTSFDTIAIGNGLCVGIDDEGQIYTANISNLDSWTSRTDTGYRPGKLIYANSTFIVPVGSSPVSSGKSNRVYRSTNGTSWSYYTLPSTSRWMSAAYGNGVWVVSAFGTNAFAYSTNGGTSWSESTAPVSGNWCSLSFGDGRFVAISSGSTNVVYSEDGINWSQSSLPVTYTASNASPGQLVYDGKKFILINKDSTYPVLYSADGINWSYSYAALTLPDGTDVTQQIANTLNAMQ